MNRYTKAGAAALAAAAVSLSGCNLAKAGTKCTPGAAPARDSTHVLLCGSNGRWTRSVTLGQAADIVTSTWPAKVEVTSGANQSVAAGGSFKEIAVKVTKRDGSVLAKSDVEISGPATGASLTTATATTDANGVARFTPTAGTVAGTFDATVRATAGTKPSATVRLTVTAASPDVITTASGDNQTANPGTLLGAPLVVKVADKYGNPATGTSVTFVSRLGQSSFTSGTATVDANGTASTGVVAFNDIGPEFVTATTASGAKVHFVFGIGRNIDEPAGLLEVTSGAKQSVDGAAVFPEPVTVKLTDGSGAVLANKTVKFEVIANGAISGTLSAASVTTDASGLATVTVRSNGKAGTFAVRATSEGHAAAAFLTTF